MKIYFTCTTAELNKYQTNYFSIRDYIVEQGHTLTRDWLGVTNQSLNNNLREVKDIRRIYLDSLKAIRDAEVVIVEDTVSNFSTGHQITIALQMRKPTLVMWNGTKHRQFNKMFIHGIQSDLLTISEYNLDNYKDIINKFLKKQKDVSIKNRFNLVINDYERNYLDWAQFYKGKSRTRIIKDLLNTQIEGDHEYQEYINK
jgi:hypoxanthine-guanine phosphoribosyltransferase